MTSSTALQRKKPPAALSEVSEYLRSVLAKHLSGAEIANISALTPDASLRRYYRVSFSRTVPPLAGISAVAMLFDGVSSPEATGFSIDSDQAYVELSRYFHARGVAVPELYVDAREDSLLLIEDLGDRALIDFAKTGPPPEVQQVFQRAIDQIQRIQSIPQSKSCFAFERSFRASTYVREMEEFRDFCLLPKQPGEEALRVTEQLFAYLGALLESFPQVLVHRDFHAWNLLIGKDRSVSVIDFQDALLATHPYDLVSLLNDRDMDSVLGRDIYRSLVFYGAERLGGGGSPQAKQNFLYEYDRALLQRDLKTSGRFAKLATVRGLTQYAAWIPGNLRRIGRTLSRIIGSGPEVPHYEQFFEAVRAILPGIGEGAKERERFS